MTTYLAARYLRLLQWAHQTLGRSLARLAANAVSIALLTGANVALAADDAFFTDVRSVGQGLLSNLMWISGMGAMLGFIMAGHAFSSGDVDRGKTMLKGTIIGAVCIFGSVSLVHFIQSKMSQPAF